MIKRAMSLYALIPIILHGYDTTQLFNKHAQKWVPLVIVGGGVAGLAAGIYGGNAHIPTLIITGNLPGGQLGTTGMVENMPAVERKNGPEIIKTLEEQANSFGAEFLEDIVTAVTPQFDNPNMPHFIITTQAGDQIYALAVIIATGATPRTLNIPGEKEYWAQGVSACAVCDAPMMQNKDIVVIGGGDAAIEEAMQLADYARSVTLLVRKGEMRASAHMQEKLKGFDNVNVDFHKTVTEIWGDMTGMTKATILNTLTGTQEERLYTGLFLGIGHIPASWPVRDIVTCDPQGYIQCVFRQQTSVPGIFACGDVTDPVYRQAGVAAGDAIKAALDAIAYLRDHGFNNEVKRNLAA